MRKRRGIELTPLLGVGSADGESRACSDEADADAPEHEAGPRCQMGLDKSVRPGCARTPTSSHRHCRGRVDIDDKG
jgi:hypothetical protein